MKLQDRSGSDADLSIPGICLAKAQLFNTLDTVPGVIPILLETALWSVSIQPGQVVARLYEFDIQSPLNDITVRSVVKLPGTSSGSFADGVAPDDVLGHVRGWWPRSGMHIKWDDSPSSAFECRPDGGTVIRNYGICEDDGALPAPELDPAVGFGKLSGTAHTHDTANKGAYGVDLHYERGLKNTGSAPGLCYVSMRSRATGYKYWGAAHVYEPENVPAYGVPKIPATLAATTMSNSVDLMQGDISDHAVNVAPGGSPTLKIHVVNGGAATLPVSVFLAKPTPVALPVEEPQ